MKKILILVVIVIIVIAAMFGFGLGLGKGDGRGEGDEKNNTIQEDTQTDKSEETTEINSEEDEIIIKVSVVGNEYFYENERISLDDFVSRVKEMKGNLVVEVKDDKASLKAYKGLINRMKELNISIREWYVSYAVL